jgi:hypothetical protein
MRRHRHRVAEPDARRHRRVEDVELVVDQEFRQAQIDLGALHRHHRRVVEGGIAEHLLEHFRHRQLVAHEVEAVELVVVENAALLLRPRHHRIDRRAVVEVGQVLPDRLQRLLRTLHRRPVADQAAHHRRLVARHDLFAEHPRIDVVPFAIGCSCALIL